ncbi:MAG: hypothetical protein C0505_08485 [Leptothrix sp. (in: Bacteria)]|nr:hypothetical protein [Leptothrix sp. (in: b-proteobacteria)]
MEKSPLDLAALTAFAGVASAQSSVTLFGIVDAAARDVKNGSTGSLKTPSSGGGGASRLGLRGIEDLGGDLRAGFRLEGQVDTDTGNSAFNFTRRSTASLIGSLGELRLGRDFVTTNNHWGNIDIFGCVGVATTANLRGLYGNFNSGGTGTSASAGTGANCTTTASGPAGMFRGATSTGYGFGITYPF